MSEYVYAGLTSQTVDILILDSSSTVGAGLSGLVFNSAGLVASYRQGATGARAPLGLATQTVGGAWTSGGFVEIDPTNMKGVYRLDLSDAMVNAEGFVTLSLYGATNMVPVNLRIDCRPVPSNIKKISDDSVAADNAEAFFDGTGYAGTGNVIPTVSLIAANGINAASIATNAIDADAIAADAVTEIQSGLATSAALATAQADLTTLIARLTAARAGYLDNLNVGGVVASQADINALNQSASRRIILTTVGQYERPEAGSTTYTIEARTYDGDGAAVNADSTPTLTGTGQTSGSLAANISAATNPATGLYRWTYTQASTATLEPIRFDISATLSASVFTLSYHTQSVDFVAATFSTTDQSNLTAIFNKLPSRAFLAGSTAATGALVTADLGMATANFDVQVGDIPTNAELATSQALADDATLAAIAAEAVKTAAIQAVTVKLDTGLVLDGAVYQWTANALELAPAGGGGGDATLANQVLILAAIQTYSPPEAF